MELIVDHPAQAVARLSQQFKTKPLIVALLKSWVTQVQELENALWDLREMRTLSTATGIYLDEIGAIVGQPRNGMDDDTYRVWISARVLVNRSSGTTEQVIGFVKKLVGESVEVWLDEQYPAAFAIQVGGIDPAKGVEIARLLQLAKPAGVGAQFQWSRDGDVAFRFSSDGSEELNVPYGFGRGRFAAVSDGGDMGFLPIDTSESGGAETLLVVL